jgi:hypothetical protein
VWPTVNGGSGVFENLLCYSRLPKAERHLWPVRLRRRALRLVVVDGSRVNQPACSGTYVCIEHLRMVRWLNAAPFTGIALESTAQLRRKGVSMRKHRDLKACISLLEELQGRGSVDPEQRQAVEYAVDELKLIRRRPNLKQHELHESIRTIVETLVRAFTRRD